MSVILMLMAAADHNWQGMAGWLSSCIWTVRCLINKEILTTKN